MVQFLEGLMLICFGISWPISVYKSFQSRSTQGKSVIFTVAILIGYIAGIFSKIIGCNINYVLYLYIFNFIVISIDFALYFVNRRHERAEREALSEKYGNKGNFCKI